MWTFANIVGKAEQEFSRFSYFLLYQNNLPHLICYLQMPFVWTNPKKVLRDELLTT